MPLIIKNAEDKGLGVFAGSFIPKGAFVSFITGIIRTTAELDEDMYAFQVADDMWITSYGGRTDDYINHSCAPNSGFVGGYPTLYALRDIAAGEEITYDYSTCMNDETWELECMCNNAGCRGLILPYSQLPLPVKSKLQGTALKYLREAEITQKIVYPAPVAGSGRAARPDAAMNAA